MYRGSDWSRQAYMGLRNRTGADGTDRPRFIPNPVAADAIAAEVGDDPDDLDTWDATLGKWATATKTGGGAYHRGPNALPALFERFRDNRRTRRDKLDAIMRKAAEAAAVKGDVLKAPEGIMQVSQERHPTQEAAVERGHPEGLTGNPDAGAPEHPQWFVRLLEGMTARADDAPSRGLMKAAKPVTGEVGSGDHAVGISVPSITLRWWKDRRIDLLAISVADGLGLTLSISGSSSSPMGRQPTGEPARRGSPGRLIDPAVLAGTLKGQLATLVETAQGASRL